MDTHPLGCSGTSWLRNYTFRLLKKALMKPSEWSFWSSAVYCSLGTIRKRKTNSLLSLSFFFKSTATVALGHRESLILTQQNGVVGESREDSLPGSLFSTETLWKLNVWKCPSHFRMCALFFPKFTQCHILLPMQVPCHLVHKVLMYPTACRLYGLFHIYFNYRSIPGQCIYFKSHYLQLPKPVSTKRTVSI